MRKPIFYKSYSPVSFTHDRKTMKEFTYEISSQSKYKLPKTQTSILASTVGVSVVFASLCGVEGCGKARSNLGETWGRRRGRGERKREGETSSLFPLCPSPFPLFLSCFLLPQETQTFVSGLFVI